MYERADVMLEPTEEVLDYQYGYQASVSRETMGNAFPAFSIQDADRSKLTLV